MWKPPPRRFREFERRPDFEGEQRRVTWRDAPSSAATSQRAQKVSSRPTPVDFTNEATVIDRRRANGALGAVQKGKLEASRASSAISAANAKRKAQAAFELASKRAKPSGADRRAKLFTQGPKTFYGTFARIVPTAGGRFRFVLPAHVVPCVQRATRREVLFAKKLASKGAGSRRRRRGPNSHIGC